MIVMMNSWPALILIFPLLAPTSDYEKVKKSIAQRQNEFKISFDTAGTQEKDSLIKLARKYILRSIAKEIIPSWYGTPWDFNGCTETPKEGKIACGYFVMTVLRDAGFKIPRIKWSQSASEPIIKILCPKLKRFHNAEMKKVEAFLKESGEGLYIVGLDCHVGFILRTGNKNQFIHSSYYHAETGVMSEKLDSDNPLKDSKYRVIGKLLSNEMVLKWISSETYNATP